MSEINLTTEQLRGFAKEIQESSKEEFLVNRKAIKVREGVWSIMKYDGLKLSLTEAFGGYFYENDIPYTFWSEVLKQVDGFIYRREQAEKARLSAMAPTQ
jgi:hypothetical protein